MRGLWTAPGRDAGEDESYRRIARDLHVVDRSRDAAPRGVGVAQDVGRRNSFGRFGERFDAASRPHNLSEMSECPVVKLQIANRQRAREKDPAFAAAGRSGKTRIARAPAGGVGCRHNHRQVFGRVRGIGSIGRREVEPCRDGTGLRDGAVQISAAGNIALEGAQIGHVGSSSPAVSGAGATTWLAVSKDAPSDPSGGSLLADAVTEFGGSEVRFYLPRRGNNGVAAGAWINGTPYDGGVGDPWPVQRADEYTRYIETAGGLLEPADHNSIPGDGPAPVTAGAYAFYYDTIVQGGTLPPLFPPLPPTSSPLFPGPSGPPPASDPDHASSFPDDRTLNDWLKELEERYSGPGEFSILYEGYDHYGPNGESIYHFPGLSEP